MSQEPSRSFGLSRRKALTILASAGIGSAVFRRALAAQTEEAAAVTPEMVKQAEWVAGLELSEEHREQAARALTTARRQLDELRKVQVAHEVPPATTFYPLPPDSAPQVAAGRSSARLLDEAPGERPDDETDLAFLPVSELAPLVRTRKVSSTELTKLYLERLKQFDSTLHCVVTLTEDLALKQAARADREIGRGHYRGPLHGIPWGAKDLIAYPGYKTTWGAAPYKDQTLKYKATVARRLDDAGAVLVGKLTLGALAWGDTWFGGITRNPWNPKQGSSGSSAGSASATVAGLVGFSLGSETLGSIVSPSRRCGATGLRPTFGRVSRFGCMTLAWTMDKLGPICRSVEDCALVFSAIQGRDGLDHSVVDRSFSWPDRVDISSLRVGYFADDGPEDREELKVLAELGVNLVPIKLPDTHPVWPMTIILNVESATVFDHLVREGVTEGLFRWPNAWRQGQFVPAVEYVRANRIRTLLIEEMQQLMSGVDAYVGGNDVAITNLTGHPTIVMPGPLRKRGNVATPGSVSFTGRLFDESRLLALAHAYQQATGHHLMRPPLKLDEPNEAKPGDEPAKPK